MIRHLLKRIFYPEPAQPLLLTVTPPRTGEHTLLGVENLLQSIAAPEPFSLELAADQHGLTLMIRCLAGEVVRRQIAAHYPQARIEQVQDEQDPLSVGSDEQAWSVTMRPSGPAYVPLRVFRDDDLLALIGALSALSSGERVSARLMLRPLDPGWSRPYLERVHALPGQQSSLPVGPTSVRDGPGDPLALTILGLAALAALRGYAWFQSGETWSAVALCFGVGVALIGGSWAWRRWRKARQRAYDPQSIREKVSHGAFEAALEIVAILPADTDRARAEALLGRVVSAYQHYDHPAGARFNQGPVRQLPPCGSHSTTASVSTTQKTRVVQAQRRTRRARGGRALAPARRSRRDP